MNFNNRLFKKLQNYNDGFIVMSLDYSWLDLYHNNSKIDKNVIVTDDDIFIDVTIPINIDKHIPIINGLESIECNICNKKYIYNNFKYIINGNIRIFDLNESVDVLYAEVGLRCSCCKSGNETYMKRCNICYNHICEKCCSEKNNISSDTMFQCFKHEKQKPFIHDEAHQYLLFCDICRKSTFVNKGVWKTNRVLQQDLCPECIDTDKATEMLTTGIWFDNTYYDDEFGSLLDWIPLINDQSGFEILYNINKKSNDYHTILLRATDDHGRCGYYKYNETLTDVIQELKNNEIKRKQFELLEDDQYDSDDDDSVTNSVYNCDPIECLMHIAMLPTHFG
jgi:hypothetical protein